MLACDHVLLNATTINQAGQMQKRQTIAIAEGRIVWCGDDEARPAEFLHSAALIEDCEGQLVTPGLIDCHTHLVYAGTRVDEFNQRLQGLTYEAIAQNGGGILSTVTKTRAASAEELLEQSLPRVLALRAEGVTTLEIKSGYGLDLENELKILRVAKRLGELSGVRVQTTFLGAHAIPSEFQNNRQAYIDFLCTTVLPAVAGAGLADAVDVFCDSIAFTCSQAEQIFTCAQAFSLPIKCHADQLSNLGATELAARFGALSCDHLEYLTRQGAMAMANNGTVAVLLPGAYYFLRETRKPPVALLRELGVGMAIASDANPGSSPTASLLLMFSMACQFFSLTVSEVWSAVTYQAAKALNIHREVGSIAVGLSADLVHWSVNDSALFCYRFGYPIKHRTMIAGKWIHE